VLSVFVPTSRLYDFLEVIPLLLSLLRTKLGLTVLAIYLIVDRIWRVRHYDNLINEFKLQHSGLTRLID
jgi:hypothetical protein